MRDFRTIWTCDECSVQLDADVAPWWSLRRAYDDEVVEGAILREPSLDFCCDDCLKRWVSRRVSRPNLKAV